MSKEKNNIIKITKVITVIIIVVAFALNADKLLPQSKEIDNMEVIKVVGLDYEEKSENKEKAILSLMMDKENGDGQSESSSSSKKQEVIRYSAKTMNEALSKTQYYTDKFVEGSHIKFFVIGEETARTDIDKALDEISKDKEMRPSSHMYLIKDMKAYEFLENIVAFEYELSDKLESMEKKSGNKTIIKPLTISELLSGKLSDSGIYLIPTLNYVTADDNLSIIKEEGIEEAKKLEKQFDFYGYGIMKDSKLVDFLNEDQATIYNMLMNYTKGGNIEIETDSNEIISFSINNISTSYDFVFEESGALNTVNISVKFKSDFEEIYNEDNPTSNEKIKEYEKLQNEKIENEVKELVQKTKELNLDILNIEGKLKLKHPYKYRKVKDVFKSYSKINITVEVQSQIERTYDVVKIEK